MISVDSFVKHFFCLLSLSFSVSSMASPNKVIFLSPNKAYFIGNQGKENGYDAGKDVCFDDPKVGRITCARIYLSTPTASAYVLLSKFSDFATLSTIVSPLRWRVKDRNYNKPPNTKDVEYLKSKLAHLDTNSTKTESLAKTTKSKNEKKGETAKGLNEGSNLAVRSAEIEKAKEEAKGKPKVITKVVEKVVEKVVVVEKPAKTVIQKEVVEKVVYKDRTKVVYKDSLFENILNWPLKVETSYLIYLSLPALNNRVIFKTQSEGETTYWSDLGETGITVPGFRIRAKQYITKHSFYGIKFSLLNATQDSATTQYDTRVNGSKATITTNFEGLSYGIEYGGRILGKRLYSMECSAGLSIFSSTKSLSSSYTSGSSSGSLANVTQNSNIYLVDTEILSKIHYGDFSGLFGLGLGFSAFSTGDEPEIDTFDPNLDTGSQSANSKTQLQELYAEDKNTISYSLSFGIEYSF